MSCTPCESMTVRSWSPVVLAFYCVGAGAAAVAKEAPFSLTPVRDVAGGGCVGETRIFAELAATKDLEGRR